MSERELELKFQVPPRSRASLLKAVGQRRLERVELAARYFDTPDQLLARHRMALRLRRENDRWVQTLKASRPHTLERFEHEVPLGAGDADASGRLPELGLHEGTDVGDALRKLLAAHPTALVETYRVEVTRLQRRLTWHGTQVEWALDEGRIVAGERVHAISELELELVTGDPLELYAMAHDWQARHGLWLDVIPKAQRGSLLVAGRPFVDAAKADAPALARGMDGPALLRAVVAACLAQILPNASELAAGSAQPAHVHQARVGLRRLRVAFRELDDFAPGVGAHVEAAVTPVFEVLGRARDAHVMATELAPRLARAGAPITLLPPHTQAHGATLAQTMRGPAFQGLLLRLLAFAHGGSAPSAAIAAPLPLPLLRDRLERLQRRIVRDAKRFEELDFDAQHHLRKRLKRLRYLAGFVAPLFKARRVDAWVEGVERAQDALGAHVDDALAARRFEAAASDDARAWFAVGWLRARSRATARAGRRALERMGRAEVFW